MSAPPPCSDPAVFEQENARVGGNWEAYFAKHPDLRGIPGLVFPGTPDQPVAPACWDAFGLFFDGITVSSDENKLKVAQNARNWFQLLFIWVGRLPPERHIDQGFLTAFGADYAKRHGKDPQACCSEDMFMVMISFMEARKEAIGRLVDTTGFERLLYFIDTSIRDTKDRIWILPPRIHHIVNSVMQPNNDAHLQAQVQQQMPQNVHTDCQATIERYRNVTTKMWNKLRDYENTHMQNLDIDFQWGPDEMELYLETYDD
ncbi:hypothetical protein LY78DRAFT_686555 [Colletotrichum sublineola]|uniref:Uncharacterized protein n=1 Tax=Colletotrichum sublineola TaxID=1173701 RepID=A0A066WYL8_COLSU|nr:hypothetical protein LY78DRAFT_686555 [Colletotrichum sublineola]KDN60514.1 hypothetical protein CSUB01_06101 [Colletotrichum sublineola]